MKLEKFESEIKTLKKFFECYCLKKHTKQEMIKKSIQYKNETFNFSFYLCEECKEKVEYSIDRLLECPHEEKPRCRLCPNKCYDKQHWKDTAKVMRYSGLRLGLLSIKKKLNF